MKTFAIKTNNNSIVQYLLNRTENMDLDNVYLSCKEFKIYTNIIIHYKGESINKFQEELTSAITDTILKFYKEYLIMKLVNFNYFYFDEYEKDLIIQNCYNIINSPEYEQLGKERVEIYKSVYEYVIENRTMILEGFINFRLKKYIEYLDNILDIAVNKYIIEKEYKEFISLLKIYINSRSPGTDFVYLIYFNSETTILDRNKNVISTEESMKNVKYLSDISFSSNDLALNTLLTILPEKIEIHLLDKEDEFINTLKLIFENRVHICSNTIRS